MQINPVLNDNDRMLDLVWTNDPDKCFCKECSDNILSNEIHHKALKIEIDFEWSSNTYKKKEYYRDFTNANYDEINKKINEIKWCEVLNNKNSLQSKVNKFYDIINTIISKQVKLKEVKKSSHPLWYDEIAINLKNRINRLHKKMKDSDTLNIQNRYKEMKSDYTKYIRMLYYDYKIEMQQKIVEDPQIFFKHVKMTRKQKDDIPNVMYLNNQNAETSKDIAELFRQFFESVYSVPQADDTKKFNEFYTNNNHMQKLQNVCINVPEIKLNEMVILQCINELPNNMVMGPTQR